MMRASAIMAPTPHAPEAPQGGSEVDLGDVLVEGKASKGRALERALEWNHGTGGHISSLVANKDGTIEYKDGDNLTIFTTQHEGGLHPASLPGEMYV